MGGSHSSKFKSPKLQRGKGFHTSLVPSPLLRQNTMARATYQRKDNLSGPKDPESMMALWTHGSRRRKLRAFILNHQAGSRKTNEWWGKSLNYQSLTHNDTLPPASPHLLNLLKQCHQLRTKYPNVRDNRGHSHSNHRRHQNSVKVF